LYVPYGVCAVPVLMHIPAVAERLKREGKHEIFEEETMEELEDEEGNVYNRKTYDDLKKQGLI
jgi:splicing factor 3A subunit 3